MASNTAVVKFVRVRRGDAISYGVLEGDSVQLMEGNPFGDRKLTGESVALKDVELLRPCEPTKVLCVGLNYASHLQGREAPTHPEIFYKPLSALQDPEGPIEIPLDSKDLHFEAEVVIVIDGRSGGPAMVAGQGVGHIRAAGAMHRHRSAIPQQPNSMYLERRSGSIADVERPDLRCADHGELCQPLRDPAAGRCDLHRDAGKDEGDEARRRRRSRDRGHRDAAQSRHRHARIEREV